MSNEQGLAAGKAALHQSQLQYALAIWRTVREFFPDHEASYRVPANALSVSGFHDDAEAIASEGVGRLPQYIVLWIERAWIAHRRRDFREASSRWEAIQERFSGQHWGYTGAAVTAREAGLHVEAEALLQVAVKLAPDQESPAIETAALWARRAIWPRAASAWAHVRMKFPHAIAGYLGGVEALAEMGDLEAAEALANEAVHRFPSHPEPLTNHAQLAGRRLKWNEAAERWDAFRRRFPDQPIGYARGGEALSRLSRYDEADQLLSGALERFPGALVIAIEWAKVPQAKRQDWGAVMERWTLVQSRFPDHAITSAYAGAALREAGRLDEAERLLSKAIERFPTNLSVGVEYAYSATSRNDLVEAERRWLALKRLYPENNSILYGLGELRLKMSYHANEESSQPRSVAGDGANTQSAGTALLSRQPMVGRSTDDVDLSDHDIAMKIESLGDNCEVGIVQRRCGAEPLGLLRWSATPYDKLLLMLETEFGGVGLPENTILEVDKQGEYVTGDTRYFWMHTFIREHEANADELFKKIRRRMDFLRRKVIEDLSAGEKLFVYKQHQDSVSREKATELHKAMRRYGRSRLLCVSLSDRDHLPGTTEVLNDGLFMGRISQLPTDPHTTNKDAWLTVLRAALQLAS